MSKVLSVYNEAAFCEIVLPAVTDSEYTYLLDADLFKLKNNERIMLECTKGEWKFVQDQTGCVIRTIDPQTPADHPLAHRGRYGLITGNGENLTILAEERENPFQSYTKYPIVPGGDISIGLEKDNAVCYSYSCVGAQSSFVSRHHCILRCREGQVVLEDTSSNGTYVNNIRVCASQPLRYGDSIRIFGLNLIFLGNMIAMNHPQELETGLNAIPELQLPQFEQKGDPAGSSQKNLFFRAPRTVPKVNLEPITIDPPPAQAEMSKMPLFMQIGPALTMTIPMILGSSLSVMGAKMGGGNSLMMYAGLITAAASALIGVFWALMNMRYQKKTVVEKSKKRFEKYGKYLIEKQNHIETLYQSACEALRRKYLPPSEIAEYTAQSEDLWSRNFNHSDMLTYRLGLGSIPFAAPIHVPAEKFTMEDDALEEKPRLIRDRFKTMQSVPVCIDLKEKSLVGVVGETSGWAQIIKDLLAQIAGSNSYTDVKIAFVYDADQVPSAKAWEFVKWLPHTWSEDKRTRYYATGKKEASEVFYELSQVMRVRSDDEKAVMRPYYILFVLNAGLLEGELLSKYIGDGSSRIGLSTVIAAERYEDLPNNCETIIENGAAFKGSYSTIDEYTEKTPIEFDQVSDECMMRFAKRMANIQVNGAQAGGEIPAGVSFFDMYGIAHPQQLHAGERWRRCNTAQTMKALVGLKSGGKECYLDIHEKYHGPHGLVAGTTGSGKSETLQTYMLSLAINYSPDDVGFFIIDYKGGGMANLFDGLPHVIGAISNLSGNQVRRAMVSIKSENKRRQRAFSDYGVNNINAYTTLYKNGDAKEPIPHMFIIIDEFAELKREEPDFMRELVSVAQVGRSLGVHLILATQKPAGTVDENIWSNSKFRLCLRVQDRQDSMDMLHRPDAAYLTQAGRTYLQVGNDEIFELFQSGYSGADYDKEQGSVKVMLAQMLDSVGRVDLAGNHQKIKNQKKARTKWIEILYRAAEDVLQSLDRERLLADEQLDEAALDAFYAGIAAQDADFKRSQYNDVRLRCFALLIARIDPVPQEGRADFILKAASREKVRLPEMKKKSQLEAINEYLAQEARENGYDHTFPLWMPVLPEQILLSEIRGYRELELEKRAQAGGEYHWDLCAVIGKGDDPENQAQMPISVDFGANGSYAICGTVATGKSTLLQTTLYSLISKYSSDELNIYILDFSSKMLCVFKQADQVGGVMTDNDEDRELIARFFGMMEQLIQKRKKQLAGTNYQDHVQHSGQKMPAILLVIDNYSAFREFTDDEYDDQIRKFAKEGINYGIYLMITGGGFSSKEISTSLADYIRSCICLEMTDDYQYAAIMRVTGRPVMPEKNVKGRGIVTYNERIIEFQTALACEGKSVLERGERIAENIQRINRLNTGRPAEGLFQANQVCSWEDFVRQPDYIRMLKEPELLPQGMDAESGQVKALDLSRIWTCAVSGTDQSGKTGYMKNLIRASADKGCEVCIVEIGGSEYSGIAQETGSRYLTNGQGLWEYVNQELYPDVRERAKQKLAGIEQQLNDRDFFQHMAQYPTRCIFIADLGSFVRELYDKSSAAYPAKDVLETLTGEKGAHYNICYFAEISDHELSDDAQLDITGHTLTMNFKKNGVCVRFGGCYTAQGGWMTYANIPFSQQEAAVRPGLGTMASTDPAAPQERIAVPEHRG